MIAAALAATLAACSGGEPSAEAPPVLKERHDNFEAIGDAFKGIRGELEKDTPDFGAIAAKASEINTLGGKIEGHFPAGTSVDDGFKTEALATIWEKPEEFKAATQKLLDESAKLAEIAPGADKEAVGAQVMALGGACKDCHDNFRLDDEK
jgi:cytochrome c556